MRPENWRSLSPDQRIRSLERAAAFGDPDAVFRLERELLRLGLTPVQEDPDPAWIALLQRLEQGPLVLATREVKKALREGLHRDPQVLCGEVGIRLVLALNRDRDRARYDELLGDVLIRSDRGRRAVTARYQHYRDGTLPRPDRPWATVADPYRRALEEIDIQLLRHGGVISHKLPELRELTNLDTRDLMRLLRALRDGLVPDWRITAELFGDEWVLTY